ncbi:MAG TPA: hypothetical protein VLI94_06615 [Solirubrobacterales bacterium]|nr:hypothetical protein [Solirubrobacterales bacterium]
MALRDRAEEGRRLLDRYLFPEPAPPTSAAAAWEKAGLAVALLALGIVLQLARIGPAASLNSLWAEDGQIFLQGALTQGFGDALGSEYSGYLVVVPRLIAEVAALVPLEGAAAAVALLSAVLVALCGLAVWHAAAGHIADPYLRGALVLATVLTPVGGLESIDSASYASWYMLFALFWILLWRPRTLAGSIWGGALIALAVLSNPGSWFFLPLAILRAFAVRDRRDATIVGAYFAASAIQLSAMLRSGYEGVEPLWSAEIGAVFLQRVVDGAAFGLRLGGGAWEVLGWPFLIALTAAVAAGFAFGLRRGDGRARAFALVALPTAVGMFVLSVYQRAVGPDMLWTEGMANGSGGRYAIVPVLLVLSTAMVLVERHRPRAGDAGKWISLGLAGLVLLSVAVSYPAGDTAVRGTPAWDDAIDAAAASCASEGVPAVAIPTSPPGFQVALPCSELPAGSER